MHPSRLSDGAGGVFSTQIVNQTNTPSEFEDAGYFWQTRWTRWNVSDGKLILSSLSVRVHWLEPVWVVADAIRVSVAPTLTVEIADAAVE